MEWELSSDRPVYLQLIEQIQNQIITGVYKPGDKLPSVRELAAEAGVNPNTMQKSLTELERSGLLFTNRTSGRFITTDEKIIKELKKQSVENQILDFIDKMIQLGYNGEEIRSLISKALLERNL